MSEDLPKYIDGKTMNELRIAAGLTTLCPNCRIEQPKQSRFAVPKWARGWENWVWLKSQQFVLRSTCKRIFMIDEDSTLVIDEYYDDCQSELTFATPEECRRVADVIAEMDGGYSDERDPETDLGEVIPARQKLQWRYATRET